MDESAAPIVVALGGNAISRAGEEGNIPQQFARSRETAVHLADLIESGRRLVITHGNGPQVGSVVRRVELSLPEVYGLPLDTCVADTQAGMGYMIAQCLNNELHRRGIDRIAGTIVTTVIVDGDDEAFNNPTKPIGTFYPKARAESMMNEEGWRMVEVPGRGYRRVVPSPPPRAIVEIALIRKLVEAGEIIIAAGGGGIPVTRMPDGSLVGCEAVIDKDRTSALLAADLRAGFFLLVTNVDGVKLDFGAPAERAIDHMTVAEARRYLDDGQFPPGSMGPKIEAGIAFLEQQEHQGDAAHAVTGRGAPGRGDDRGEPGRVVICDVEHLYDAVQGHEGTTITVD